VGEILEVEVEAGPERTTEGLGPMVEWVMELELEPAVY